MRLSLTSWLVFYLCLSVSSLKVEKSANQAVSGWFFSQGYGRLITQAFNVQSVMGCEGISWAREAAMLV